MIEVRPMNPVRTTGDTDPLIGRFADSEWWNLIELARRYGFKPPDAQIHFPRPYDHPVEIDTEASQSLWEAISAVYREDVVPYASTWEGSNATASSGRAELPNRPPEEGQVCERAPTSTPSFTSASCRCASSWSARR